LDTPSYQGTFKSVMVTSFQSLTYTKCDVDPISLVSLYTLHVEQFWKLIHQGICRLFGLWEPSYGM